MHYLKSCLEEFPEICKRKYGKAFDLVASSGCPQRLEDGNVEKQSRIQQVVSRPSRRHIRLDRGRTCGPHRLSTSSIKRRYRVRSVDTAQRSRRGGILDSISLCRNESESLVAVRHGKG